MTAASSAPRVLVMAGGTGGHVIPALAVAQALRTDGVHVSWLGTQRGIESRLVPGLGFEMDRISVAGLRGKGVLGWLLAPLRLSLALAQAAIVILRRRPTAVLGMGGFVTGPGGLAAWLLRRPLLIHEQNAVPGLTNRLLAPLASKVMEAFPGTFPAKLGAQHTGNPVRPEIVAVEDPATRLAGRTAPVRLLILGGSQGAHALNATVPEAIARLSPADRPEVRHQAGERDLDATRRCYAELGVAARVEAFIDDMAGAYGWADLVIGRAGALTLAELAAAGVAAILIPYPYAVDDHQTRNAGYLERVGAAVRIDQRELDAKSLAERLRSLCGDRGRLMAMAQAARGLAMPRATAEVAATCLEAARR